MLALVAYSALLLVVLLSPSSGAQSAGVSWAADLATGLGVSPELLTPTRAEFLCNAAILMPVSALGSIVWPRTTWREWTAYGFLGAGLVELIQGLLLPGRDASYVDVVANTLGAMGGAVVVTLLSRRRTAGGTPPSSPAGR